MKLCRHICCLALAAILANCAKPPNPNNQSQAPARIQIVHFTNPLTPLPTQPPAIVRGARNETIHFAIQINEFPALSGRRPPTVRFHPLQAAAGTIPLSSFGFWQVLPMPIDTNRADFVRHTGASVSTRRVPRALLPLTIQNDSLNLADLRNPDDPANPASHPEEQAANPPIIWIDIQIPPTVPAGRYDGNCELVENGKVTAMSAIQLEVEDFVIPDERHLLMVGQLDWQSLVRLYPEQFKSIADRPRLLNRREPQYAAAIRTLDEIVKQAENHRTEVIIPRLQPSVSWPSGSPPQVDWSDFDSIVSPWLKGQAFADLIPLGYWPLPVIDGLDRHDESSRLEYWQNAAGHFDGLDWLLRSSVAISRRGAGRVDLEESVELSGLAARILASHPRIRVTVPLEEEQIQLASPAYPRHIAPDALSRLLYAAPGLVSVPPLQRLPDGTGVRWLRTDLPGLIPYLGAGADEREVRLWSWLAYLRNAALIQWPSVLPSHSDPAATADPEELVWFYPGSWFKVDHPLPSVQLKWLRRAQQDYEYLWLAKQRGQGTRASELARLITKPVELNPAQRQDPIYGLMSGAADPAAWTEATNLLSRTVLLSQPGQTIDAAAEKRLAYDLNTWRNTQDRPLILGRTTDWLYSAPEPGGQPRIGLHLGIDIYNAAERQPVSNKLQWGALPEGWRETRAPLDIPKLGTYHVDRFSLPARISSDKIGPASRQPLKITFIDGYTSHYYFQHVVAPVAICEHRQGPPPQVDGSLGDWMPEDALHEGKMVRMYSRPAIQRQELQFADKDSAIYSTWTAANLYLGFRVEGVDSPTAGAGRSYVDYQLRRVWGEDVCEILIQPVYPDNTEGPALHIAAKPLGQLDISRRLDPRQNAHPWQAFSGADIRYGGNIDDKNIWRGELAIPWEALADNTHPGQKPVMLRFNFSQHQGSTGQSFCWAGPVDFGRDESFTGVLEIRRP